MKKSPRIIVGCEYSGVTRNAFRKLGFEAWSCDLKPSLDNSPYHYQCDIFDLLDQDMDWALGIFHPDCTFLCNSGVRWLYTGDKYRGCPEGPIPIPNIDRWNKMEEGAKFFKRLMDMPIPRICIENPIPHSYALKIIGRKYDQIIQPWQHGDSAQKSTALWLKNLPKLVPTNIVSKGKMQVCKSGKVIPEWYSNNKKLRSITFPGIGRAFAEQFGAVL